MKLWSVVERFIQERRILNNVSPATIQWYQYSLKAFQPVLEAEFESAGALRAAVIQRIGELQSEGRGNKAIHVMQRKRNLPHASIFISCDEKDVIAFTQHQ